MKKIIVSVLILSLALALFGCTPGQNETDSSTTTTAAEQTTTTVAASETTAETTAAEVEEGYLAGQKALDFELKDLEGNTVKLSDYQGKTVVLNFFATWCGPCEVETPHLNETYLDMQNQDVVVLSVNLTVSRPGEKEAAATFANKYELAFPVLLDEDGSVAEMYRIRSIPTNLFISPNGIINSSFAGALNKENFVEMIEAAKAAE